MSVAACLFVSCRIFGRIRTSRATAASLNECKTFRCKLTNKDSYNTLGSSAVLPLQRLNEVRFAELCCSPQKAFITVRPL